MSGVTEVRLYRNTVDEVPAEYTNVTAAVLNSSLNDHATGIKRYLDGVATIDGLAGGTTYYFWVELVDARGNTAGPQPIGSHTTESIPADVWEFFSTGSTHSVHCINQFSYTGAGTYNLSYGHVELFGNGSKSPDVMGGFQEQGYSQLTWTGGSYASPIPAFTITIPDDHPGQIPETGWQWTQGAIRGDQLGSWKIVRNGVELSHTGTTNPGGTSQASRNISGV